MVTDGPWHPVHEQYRYSIVVAGHYPKEQCFNTRNIIVSRHIATSIQTQITFLPIKTI
jgi:hypothetical protein